jgi:hypothetical protein
VLLPGTRSPTCRWDPTPQPASPPSGAYFLNLLWNYAATPGLWNPAALLAEPLIHDAAALMLDVWSVEQHHEERSPYR